MIVNGGSPGVRLHTSWDDSPIPSFISPKGKPPRYRSMFSNSMSPLTPTFGILPLDSNTPEPTVLPSHVSITEASDLKSLAKRVCSLRAHVGVSWNFIQIFICDLLPW